MEKSVFETLNKINVEEHIETKNGLRYLSWAWAWAEVKKLYPLATYTVYETENGCCYWTDGRTAWVKTGVSIEGLEHIEYLPILDFNNKSIPLEKITSFDVNKSIQRSLTKALARHGLGLYVYAGEDLPEEEMPEGNPTPKPTPKPTKPLATTSSIPSGDLASTRQLQFIDDLLAAKGKRIDEVYRATGINRNNCTKKEANALIDYLKGLPDATFPKNDGRPMDIILEEAANDITAIEDDDELPF